MISANQKSGILRKGSVLKISKRSLYRHLNEVGEAQGLENIRQEIESTGDDELLTFREVATKLNSSLSSVHRWTRGEGLIPYRHILGKVLRVTASDLKWVFTQVDGDLAREKE